VVQEADFLRKNTPEAEFLDFSSEVVVEVEKGGFSTANRANRRERIRKAGWFKFVEIRAIRGSRS
jgi:hypothetical protein